MASSLFTEQEQGLLKAYNERVARCKLGPTKVLLIHRVNSRSEAAEINPRETTVISPIPPARPAAAVPTSSKAYVIPKGADSIVEFDSMATRVVRGSSYQPPQDVDAIPRAQQIQTTIMPTAETRVIRTRPTLIAAAAPAEPLAARYGDLPARLPPQEDWHPQPQYAPQSPAPTERKRSKLRRKKRSVVSTSGSAAPPILAPSAALNEAALREKALLVKQLLARERARSPRRVLPANTPANTAVAASGTSLLYSTASGKETSRRGRSVSRSRGITRSSSTAGQRAVSASRGFVSTVRTVRRTDVDYAPRDTFVSSVRRMEAARTLSRIATVQVAQEARVPVDVAARMLEKSLRKVTGKKQRRKARAVSVGRYRQSHLDDSSCERCDTLRRNSPSTRAMDESAEI